MLPASSAAGLDCPVLLLTPSGPVAKSLQPIHKGTASSSSLDASCLNSGAQWSYYGAKPAPMCSAEPVKPRKHPLNPQLIISFETKNSLSTR